MRHPILDSMQQERMPRSSWLFRFSCGALFILALSFAFRAFAQDAAVPPPPADPQQAQQPVSPDANNVRAVRLSDVEGKVRVLSGNDVAFDQAQPNMPVLEGMRLVTGDDGRVEIQFEDGSVARVTPNSSVTLTQLQRAGDGNTITTVDATAGLSYYELNGRGGQYTVHFGTDSVTPIDSSIFRVNLDGNPNEVAVTHGTIHISDGQNLALDVHTNQSIRLDTQSAGQYDVVQSVSADTWDQWNSDRDQALAMLEENATTARASTGNPDDPGWNDLDYYGDWYNVPGYGMAWAPAGVGPGWDPFGVGSWGYYSGIGYSWISAYPWGWWPYHCGAWNYFDGNGWMWFPGNCGWGNFGSGWYANARVWHCPPGYKPPVRPASPTRGEPWHGRGPHPDPLVAVNRGPEFAQQFRTAGGAKPNARSFDYAGQSINPVEATIHPVHTGPIGEGFTTAAERVHPEVFERGAYAGTGRASGLGEGLSSSPRGVYQPGSHGFDGRSAPPPLGYSSRPSSNPGNTTRGSISGGAAGGGGGHASTPTPSAGGGSHVSGVGGGGAHIH